eukprot:TRINITY_DN4859_c0_g2_i2.p1 TRINITY_DN4859_c0_g2~~TRINITY_DN4859_c0_g2_i2.p1  ORF type:complete len:240 (+),score=90.25 TRINITY_DN4859_c0_g2_i2:73-792(+)
MCIRDRVIFVHRTGSLTPFNGRHTKCISELFEHLSLPTDEGGPLLLDAPELAPTLQEYQAAKEGGLLLSVPFETLDQYLYLLRSSCMAGRSAGRNVCLYLAAAVSDFFVAAANMPEHKMQSSEGPPEIVLSSTPKMLACIKQEWAPESFLVSFKLETDQTILKQKATAAIHKYGIDLVIANILETRKQQVIFVTSDGDDVVAKAADAEHELEMDMIAALASVHQAFIEDNVVAQTYGSV